MSDEQTKDLDLSEKPILLARVWLTPKEHQLGIQMTDAVDDPVGFCMSFAQLALNVGADHYRKKQTVERVTSKILRVPPGAKVQ